MKREVTFMLPRSREEIMDDRIWFWDAIETHARHLDLISYIDRNGCHDSSEFLSCVMSDMRGGVDSNWYDRFFSDDEFRSRLDGYCRRFSMGVLHVDIGSLNHRAQRRRRAMRTSSWKKVSF